MVNDVIFIGLHLDVSTLRKELLTCYVAQCTSKTELNLSYSICVCFVRCQSGECVEDESEKYEQTRVQSSKTPF